MRNSFKIILKIFIALVLIWFYIYWIVDAGSGLPSDEKYNIDVRKLIISISIYFTGIYLTLYGKPMVISRGVMENFSSRIFTVMIGSVFLVLGLFMLYEKMNLNTPFCKRG